MEIDDTRHGTGDVRERALPRAVSYLPTDGLSYDPGEAVYWNREALQKEITRVFEVCHGCRMCFKYCDAFPKLFEFIDQREGQVEKLDAFETEAVMDACFQCKLCEVQCPYTPRDGHHFQLDFPKLVHRHRALEHKAGRRTGMAARGNKLLGDPDLSAKLARGSLGLANRMNRVAAHRWFMEKTLGIHRQKKLPDFASQSFESWAGQAGLIHQQAGGEAVLFQTCYVDHNEPEIGRDTVDVFRENQIDVRCVAGLVCCGMPAWEHGDLALLEQKAQVNLDLLEPFVERGAKVIAINPTCAMMLRREYPELVARSQREKARKLSKAVQDPGEFLWAMRQEPRFKLPEKERMPKAIAYHAPCHLRAQAVGFKGRDLIRKAGADVSSVVECCGHDGTYAMTVQGFEPSQRIGQKAFQGMQAAEAPVWVTDCPLAAIQFEQHAGTKPLHPMSLLARGYRKTSEQPPEPRAGAIEHPKSEP